MLHFLQYSIDVTPGEGSERKSLIRRSTMMKYRGRKLFFSGTLVCLIIFFALSTHAMATILASATIPKAEKEREQMVRKGETLVQEKGCIACHKIKGVGATIGPDLTGVTKRLKIEIIRKRLHDPRSVKPDSIMPNFGFTDEEVEDIIAYLKTL
jgi:cytochrome c2